MADPTVGRNYHSEALLLPDGRVITLGSDPLYSNSDNTVPGKFEQRIEIYSPPYLFQGDRPPIASGPEQVSRGKTVWFGIPERGSDQVGAAGAAQRRDARDRRGPAFDQADVRAATGTGSTLTIPGERPGAVGLVHAVRGGDNGAPSKAHWVHVR